MGKLTLVLKPSGLANPDLEVGNFRVQIDLGLDARFLKLIRLTFFFGC